MKEDLIVYNKPKSIISEGIRTLRTNLQFAAAGEKLKSVLITSSIPGEGKSFISANLAIAFAQNNVRTLIVDCDLRRGRQHKVFEVDNSKGLSNLLIDSKMEENYEDYIEYTKIENVFVLPRGSVPPNPSELLASDACIKLMELLDKEFDMIIYDGVPVNGLTDTLIMSKLVDKTIIVCAVKETESEALINTKKALVNVGADIAGVVVNKIPSNAKSYSDKYYVN